MIEANVERSAVAEKAHWTVEMLGPYGDEGAPPVTLAAIMAAPRWLLWLKEDEQRFLALVGALALKDRWRGRLDGAVVRALAAALGESLCDRMLASPSLSALSSNPDISAHVLKRPALQAMGRTVLLAALDDQPALASRLRRRWVGEGEVERRFAVPEAQWIAHSAHALMLEDGGSA
jgi:hypothetical protein